jgi:isoleucyl-tRNA synthetase
VLDILHRTLTAWLAPALPFTAEDSWTSRFGEETSLHTTLFPIIPNEWRDETLAEKWKQIRQIRFEITGAIEQLRKDKKIGSSLQARAFIAEKNFGLLSPEDWADVCIVSEAVFGTEEGAWMTDGQKCERCWRVLEEVGTNTTHPTLCRRCCEAIEQ